MMQEFTRLSKRKVGSLKELSYFLEELESWSQERQESQRQLDNLLRSYSGSITKGINSFIQEIGDLQVKNSAITKERDDLLVIVEKMRGTQEVDHQDPYILKVELPNAEEDGGAGRDKESTQITFDNNDEHGFEDKVDQEIPQEEIGHVYTQLDQGINEDDDDEIPQEKIYHDDFQLDQSNNDKDEDVESVEDDVLEEQETNDQFDITDHEQKETLVKNKQLNSKYLKSHINPVQKEGQSLPKTIKPHNNLSGKSKSYSKQKSNPLRKGKAVALQEYKKQTVDAKLQKKRKTILVCDQCPFETCHKGQFLQHIQVHRGKRIEGGTGKKFMCDHCPYKTSRMNNFLQHSRVHNDIRNYSCEKCPYKAKSKDALKGHVKAVHENIRDLVCDRCGYATSRPYTLSEHKQTVHNTGEKKFLCDQCPYRAYMKKILAKHVKNVHIGREYKFKCGQCDFKSNSKGNLTTHILQKHK